MKRKDNGTVEEVLFGFLKELEAFEYAMESLDHIWNVLFPSENGKWHHLRVVNYKEAYFFHRYHR